jgi:hypothetical protein
VSEKAKNPRIPESFLEHRQSFAHPWVNQWVSPNPFILPLHETLRDYGVGLSDFSFAKETSSVGETALTILIRSLNASARIGVDSVVFAAANPDWSEASSLSTAFEKVAQAVYQTVQAPPSYQETTLALHLVDESIDLRAASAKLVNTSLLGDAAFYGISIYRETGTLLIEKSLKYDDAIFLRVQHRFSGHEPFAVIAAAIYKEEVFSLGLLGLLDPDEASLP